MLVAASPQGGHDFVSTNEGPMKRLAQLPLLIFSVVAVTFAQSSSPSEAKLSPAEQSMATDQGLIERNPKNHEAYNALALALSHRARETSDVKFYAQAQAALAKSFAISPNNFEGKKIEVSLLLGKHEFAAAREEALKLSQRMPDDVMVYGFLADANVELGNYDDAERAAQLMLDLRPGNSPAITHAAYLRELFGDVDGALELMDLALQSTSPGEAEGQAWILSQMAQLRLTAGRIAEAEKNLDQALRLFPGYHYALGYLAKVRIAEKRYDEAVELLEGRYHAASNAENLYDLAQALELAGRIQEAKRAFAEFEQKSLLETDRADNSNRELIFYYAEHAHEPGKALEVAERELARRHDVHTRDAYAWALHVNGKDQEARKQIELALAVGIREARMLWHAGEIALATGDRTDARKFLEQAADLNADDSDLARASLARIFDEKQEKSLPPL